MLRAFIIIVMWFTYRYFCKHSFPIRRCCLWLVGGLFVGSMYSHPRACLLACLPVNESFYVRRAECGFRLVFV